MKRVILFLSILPLIAGTCPTGLQPARNGECRGSIGKIFTTYFQAISTIISMCKEISAQPVIIHDQQTQSDWEKASSGLVIGLVCNSNSRRWEWADGSAVDYVPPYTNKPIYQDCTTYPNGACWTLSAGQWYLYATNLNYNGYVYCFAQLHSPVPSGDSCDSFDEDSEDGVCYEVGAPANSWEDAETVCESVGASLASIHNAQENSFVRRLAVSRGAYNGLYLGGKMSGKENEFAWTDGSAWDYHYFTPGFPHDGLGECLAMDTSTTAGQWQNVNCGEQLPVACSRKKRPVVSPATCSTDIYYKMITSPGYPYNATTPCDFYLAVEHGKKVKFTLEANSCCDRLIFYDSYIGGSVISNLTGYYPNSTLWTKYSNVMRINWQPSDGRNVMGVKFAFWAV